MPSPGPEENVLRRKRELSVQTYPLWESGERAVWYRPYASIVCLFRTYYVPGEPSEGGGIAAHPGGRGGQ